ncbi:hypothetical protein [Hyalangium sp.]|uniref:hypothetical protein n=1 Tax=Hyalangium sp. TaxID=2028555 RepID=UPI002D481843|nr:hypothetical protein [Hyalangium sp.]HYH97214.1 hypothetical protein [Hyalangium sp.]
MPPAFNPSQLAPAALAVELRNQPPRQTALLRRRLVQGASLEACAAFYGVRLEAISIHLLRAALELTTAAGGSPRPPASDDEEEAWARQLSAALERETASVSPGLQDTVALCRRLQTVGKEVEAALAAIERLEAASPHRKREELIRRLAVGLLLALAAYFYLKRPPAP